MCVSSIRVPPQWKPISFNIMAACRENSLILKGKKLGEYHSTSSFSFLLDMDEHHALPMFLRQFLSIQIQMINYMENKKAYRTVNYLYWLLETESQKSLWLLVRGSIKNIILVPSSFIENAKTEKLNKWRKENYVCRSYSVFLRSRRVLKNICFLTIIILKLKIKEGSRTLGGTIWCLWP